MKKVTQNAIGIINKLIVTAKYNRNTSVGTDRHNYYEGRLSALCDLRQWINNKQKGNNNEQTGISMD